MAARRALGRFAFYDLVLRTPTHPREPLEASLMTPRELLRLRKTTKTTYQGNYRLPEDESPEERIRKVFGGRIKGEDRQLSSRTFVAQPRTVAGISVPAKPTEPDNCCMSGCVNCVWELFNDDIKHWNDKRKEAARKLAGTDERWPDSFDPPIRHLDEKNFPKSLAHRAKSELLSGTPATDTKSEGWGNVPVSIRVFAELEKKMKEKQRRKQQGKAVA